MRFLSFALGDRTPGEITIGLFRNRMTRTGTLPQVIKAFDCRLKNKGSVPICGRIVNATLVLAPQQRNIEDENEDIKEAQSNGEVSDPTSPIRLEKMTRTLVGRSR